jgi:hypothetical protein
MTNDEIQITNDELRNSKRFARPNYATGKA